VIRRLLERLSHGVTIKSRLPDRFGDFPIIVSPDARLGFWRADVEKMDPLLLAVAEEFVRPGSVVWDVGANVGIFALAAAAKAGPSGHVLAIDGDTWLVDLMRRTCKLESSPRAPIDVLPAAVDGELGIATFNIAARGRAANFLEGTGSSQTGGSRQRQRVVSVSLDWLLQHFPKPDVLKIDVEGAELRALSGATKILDDIKPTLICEVSSDKAREVTDLLHAKGYTLYDMEDRKKAGRTPLELATANIIATAPGRKS
jgi:FkbM family methyltransferase